jgi:ubiquitin carboxyl-terminal hydrolase 25/28
VQEVDIGDIPEFLSTQRDELTSELENLRSQLGACKEEVESLWATDRRMEYELTSVFIHRGVSPSFGHYFFYTRYLPDNPDSWFKLNDSEVTMVSKEEVFADSTNSTANAYLV